MKTKLSKSVLGVLMVAGLMVASNSYAQDYCGNTPVCLNVTIPGGEKANAYMGQTNNLDLTGTSLLVAVTTRIIIGCLTLCIESEPHPECRDTYTDAVNELFKTFEQALVNAESYSGKSYMNDVGGPNPGNSEFVRSTLPKAGIHITGDIDNCLQ